MKRFAGILLVVVAFLFIWSGVVQLTHGQVTVGFLFVLVGGVVAFCGTSLLISE